MSTPTNPSYTNRIATLVAEITALADRMDPVDGIWVNDPRYGGDITCGVGYALEWVIDHLEAIKDDLAGQQ